MASIKKDQDLLKPCFKGCLQEVSKKIDVDENRIMFASQILGAFFVDSTLNVHPGKANIVFNSAHNGLVYK